MKNSKNIWGIIFILGAVWIILGKIGLLPYFSIARIMLTVLLVWMLVDGIKRQNFYKILFSIAFISILYDKVLRITALTPWTVLYAALFGSIGLTMIFQGRRRDRMDENFREQSFQGQGGGTYTAGDIHVSNCFSTASRYINYDEFRMARIENNFGTLSVYFDNAFVPDGVANLRIENAFGLLNLYIPKEWDVQSYDIDRAFGSVNEYGMRTGESGVLLTIHGESNFATVRIYYI